MATDLIRGSAACYSSGTPGRAIVQVRENHLVTDDPSDTPGCKLSGGC